MSESEFAANATPEPTPSIRNAAAEIVKRLGGRHYGQAVHADRVIVDAKDGRKMSLAECGHQGTLVDLPPAHPGGILNLTAPQGAAPRLCIICDAVPRMPRIAAEARKLVAASS